MKIHVLAENLQKKLSFVNKAISTKTQLPILQNILLQAFKGKLQLSSTDLEIGIQTTIPANIEEEGEITIPAKTFTELINSLPNEKITLQTVGKILEVITKKTKNKFQTTPKDEFPALYEDKGIEITRIKREVLEKDFSKIMFAASIDTARPALSGIYMKKDENSVGSFFVVATDGYRLSLKEVHITVAKNTNKEWFEKPLLIPARFIKEVLSMKEEENEVGMYIAEKNNQVLFEQGQTLVVGRLIDVQFPNYERIIPQEVLITAVFDREEMQKAVKICAIFARDSANIIRFSVKKDTIVVSANTSSEESTVEVEAKVKGDEEEIAFNARYLLDFFANITDEQITLEMTNSVSPGVFKVKDDPSFLHLIMPIRVQTEG